MLGTYDTSYVFRIGRIVYAADINDELFKNLSFLRGIQVGQTETSRAAEVAAPYLQATDMIFDLEKQVASATTIAAIELVSLDGFTASALRLGQTLTLETVLDVAGSSEETLGSMVWERVGEGMGSFKIFNLAWSPSVPALHVAEHGGVGLWGHAKHGTALTVHGAVNTSEGYLRNGMAMNDWSRVSGHQLEWSGSAVARRFLGNGLQVASQTLCPNVNAEKLEGRQWYRGLTKPRGSLHSITSAATDVEVQSVLVPFDGTFEVHAVVEIQCSNGDTEKTFTVKLKDDSGAQFGESEQIEFTSINEYRHVHISAEVSTSEHDTLRVTVAKTGGTGVSKAAAKMILLYRGLP